MTGAEHYAEAERLLREAKASRDVGYNLLQHLVPVAQVHATLALASATAYGISLSTAYGDVS